MRIFRQRARTLARKIRFGIESQAAPQKAAPRIRLRLKKNPAMRKSMAGFQSANRMREPASRRALHQFELHLARRQPSWYARQQGTM
jgi:hypothetical protein